MITPGRHPTSCWPEKPGVTDVAPLQLPARLTPGIGTLCDLRIQLSHPSFGVASAPGVVGRTPRWNSGTLHTPFLDPEDPNLTHLVPDAISAPLSWVS